MALKATRPCRAPGCVRYALSGEQYCAEHLRETAAVYRQGRCREYSTQRWQHERAIWLAQHPLCEECRRMGRLSAATVVDHVKPHKGDMRLFWDRGNWQSLCKPCHDRKTAREDGGFGRAGRL